MRTGRFIFLLLLVLGVQICLGETWLAILDPDSAILATRLGAAALFGNLLILALVTAVSIALVGDLFWGSLASSAVYGMILVIHSVKMSVLQTPFILSDLRSWKSAFRFAPQFLTPSQLIVLGAWTLIALGLLVLRRRLRRQSLNPRIPWRPRILLLVLPSIFFWLISRDVDDIWRGAWQVAGLEVVKGSLQEEASSTGILMTIAHQLRLLKASVPPVDLRPELIESPKTGTQASLQKEGSKKPNLILFIIESFHDPLRSSFAFESDPIPFFRKLSQTSSSGELRVSEVGGGTANTEFEILTGFPTAFLSIPGTIAFHHAVQRPVEALPRILARNGYRTAAFHPYFDYVWNRKAVFPLLGFDQFYHLKDFEGAPEFRGFVTDRSLVERLIQESAGQHPFFFHAMTVASHSPYHASEVQASQPFFLKGPVSKFQLPLEAYARAIHEADLALKILIDHFAKQSDPTMIVVTGDHQPFVSDHIDPQLSQGDRFQTPILIWSNFESEKKAISLATYFLGSYLLEEMGLPLSAREAFISNIRKNHFREISHREVVPLVGPSLPGTFNHSYWIEKIGAEASTRLLQQYWALFHDEFFGDQKVSHLNN